MDSRRDVNLGQRLRQSGGAIADQHSLLDQCPYNLLHEEGIPFGFLDDQPLGLGVLVDDDAAGLGEFLLIAGGAHFSRPRR